MRFCSLALLSLLLATLPGGASSGEVAPGLQDLLAGADPGDEVRVLVVLRDQVDAPALARRLRSEKAAGGAVRVHRDVVDALQRTATAGQADLLATLDGAKAAGGIHGWRAHWLINAVVVTGRVDAVLALADHPDVARLEPDLVAAPIEPAAQAPAGPAFGSVTPGVVAVGANRVWSTYGIDGTGVVVGVIDSGVDGLHPAYADRWRGLTAPASACWLDAAGLGDTHFPVDRRFHGTHVLGTITGRAGQDTLGVAPGATWIASNAINNPGDGDQFDNAVLASLEFMTDPDGDPTTSDDVPAVVHNSWGVNPAVGDYLDCDSRWWDALDACEAAGVVLTWSVGNEGPSAGTVRSPGSRATSPTNAFSIGSTAEYYPFAVSDFSSRGPSPCGGEHATKPEVAAPGERVRSAMPGGGYQELSGTSMAGPHVAGVVALMRQANPDLDPASIKQVLMDTARDLGTPGEDNDTGWGLVDALAAVAAVMTDAGTVQGLVTDAVDGGRLAGAKVWAADGTLLATSGVNGRYVFTRRTGSLTATVRAFGHADAELSVTVTAGGMETASVELAPLAAFTVTGTVDAATGSALAGVGIRAVDTPLAPAFTDTAGRYSLELPLEAGRLWTLRATAPGHGAQDRTVATPVAGLADPVDFVLPVLTLEDFETGDFTARPWRQGGHAPWSVDGTDPWRGVCSARSGTVDHGGSSSLELDVEAAADDSVAFHLRVDSEAGYDLLQVLVDGVVRAAWSGAVPWSRQAVAVSAGPHTLAWVYTKDPAGSAGADAAWLDDITLPVPAADPSPSARLAPAAVTLAVVPGSVAQTTVTLHNDGQADLPWALLGTPDKMPVAPWSAPAPVDHLELAKDAPDPRPGTAAPLAGGGPDAEGRIWLDSLQAGGPAWAWEDIGPTGLDLGAGDDTVHGPFALGFPFPWEGGARDSVYVCSNGFLSFAPVPPAHANQGIPDPAAPNGLVALFWDDLDPSLAGSVLVEARNDRFIVQFEAVAHYGAASTTETCQAVLHADGSIDLRYLQVGRGGGCTVGLENDAGTGGLAVAFNTPGYPADTRAVRMMTPRLPTWLAAQPPAGTVAAGGASGLDLAVDARGLEVGSHRTWLHLATGDPAQALVTLPLTLVVDGLAGGGLPPAPDLVFKGAVPNPLNPSTRLEFSLPRAMTVRLRLYDVSGRLVRTLADGPLPEGPHRIPWDGTDRSGRAVASGVYFARLETQVGTRTRSLVLVR